MRRTRVVIQSRLNSSRLPGKALLTVAGMPLIELVARRASRSGHEVVVATSEEQYDSRIADHLESVGVPVMRGSLDDVLGRFAAATADLEPGDRVVRLTGDNPVADADLVDELLAAMDASGHTYGRVDIEQVPEGLGAEGFTVESLRAADQAASAAYDREHVTPWLRRELGELLFVPKDSPGDIHAYRCTVDCLADYDRVSRLFAGRPDPIGTPWREIVADLGRAVGAEGPMVPRGRAGGLDQSVVLLGGSHLVPARRRGPAGPQPQETRAMLALAVDHGISHVELDGADGASETSFRACSEPALKQRIGVVSRIAPLPGGSTAPELVEALVSARVERSFANLGRRRVDALLFAGVADARAGDGAAWRAALAYRESGEAGVLGVAVSSPDELDTLGSLDGLGYLEMPLNAVVRRWAAPAVQGQLAGLAARGVVVSVHHVFLGGLLTRAWAPDGAVAQELAEITEALEGMAAELGRVDVPDLCLAYARSPEWVASAVLGCDTLGQVRSNIAAAARAPLTAEQVVRLHEAVPAASAALLAAARSV